ncbi:MAG TPA: zf-HC2 domain-containing protein [Terriglobales bacterium]|nr:zf-HC2 domain-containing protein [Terriglobales bacterium]
MSDSLQNRAWTCAQLEEQLSEYREGTLATAAAAAARAHLHGCDACQALLQAVAGMEADLRRLPVLDPPARLLYRIQAQTLAPGMHRAGKAAGGSGWQRAWRAVWTPRFALGFAMSVFAVALLLNAAEVNLGSVLRQGGLSQLSPASLSSAVSRRFDRAWARGVAYYHDLRVVYEIEAAIHQMRQSEPAAPSPAGGDHSQRRQGAAQPPELVAQLQIPQWFRSQR